MPDATDRHVYQRDIDPDAQDSLARVISLMPLASGLKVLDVGTGDGALGRYLATRQCQVDGITYAEQEAARARPAYAQLAVADLEKTLPATLFADRRYDVIVCADILEHLRNASAVLADLKNLLAPDGRLIVSFPHAAYLGVIMSLLRSQFPRAKEGLLDETHVLFLDRAGLEKLVAGAGFHITAQADVHQSLSEFMRQDTTMLPPSLQAWLTTLPDADIYQFVWALSPDASAIRPPAIRHARLPDPEWMPCFGAQLFFDRGKGFGEDDSSPAFGVLRETPQVLTFSDLDLRDVQAVRLDLSDRPGLAEFHHLTLFDASHAPLWSWPAALGFDISAHECILTGAPGIHGGQLVHLTGHDAWIAFRPPHPAWTHAVSAELVMTTPQPYLDAAFAWADRYHRSTITRLLAENRLLHNEKDALHHELARTRDTLLQTRGSLGWFLLKLWRVARRLLQGAA